MTTQTARLYRVLKQHRYDGGRGCDRLSSQEVLYCGYDRLEAAAVYHRASAEVATSYRGPGNYYYAVVGQAKNIAEE